MQRDFLLSLAIHRKILTNILGLKLLKGGHREPGHALEKLRFGFPLHAGVLGIVSGYGLAGEANDEHGFPFQLPFKG
jgi:hypothetical protein